MAAGSGWFAWNQGQKATASIKQADERIAQADTRVAEANTQVDQATQQAKEATRQTQQAKRDQQQAVASAKQAAQAQQTAETRAREADGKAQTAAVAQQQAEASAQAADAKAQDAAARASAADLKTAEAEKAQRLAQTGTRLEQASNAALSRLDFDTIGAVLNALKSGTELDQIASDEGFKGLSDYPAVSPILALQQIQSRISQDRLFAHESSVTSAAFSPDGQRVVTASDDGTARVWQAESGEAIAVLAGPESFVTSAAFSPDGQRVVTASDDGTARVWDLQGRQLAIYEGSPAALSPNGRQLATVIDGRVQIYDIDTLPELLAWGCQWLHNYLEYGPATDADRAICNLPPRPVETAPAGPFESSLGQAAALVGVSWPEQG